MREDEQDQDGEKQQPVSYIPLNGTYGAGPVAELTIITVGENGTSRETIFEVPYVLLDLQKLQRMCDLNFFRGYKVIKPDFSSSGLKALGL